MKDKKRIASAAVILSLLAAPLSSSAQDASLSRTLALGSSGSDVTVLQTFLAQDANIYPEGLVTGYYGALTSAAVARFQASIGLPQMGSVGPLTREAINQRLATEGIDDRAPILGPDSVVATRDGATITWTTNEPSSARVMYASVRPFLYDSAYSATGATGGQSHGVTITGLVPGRTYYYTVESVDPRGNVSLTLQKSFSTQP